MKKLFGLFIILGIFSFILTAEDYVSNPEEYNTIITNPAGQAYFDNLTIGYQRLWTKNNEFKLKEEKKLFLNFKTIGYAMDTKGKYHHTLSSSQKLFNNFYFGNSYDWSGKDFKEGSYNLGFLYRPANFISFGTMFSDVFDEKNHKADFGVSLRPIYLKGKFCNRFDINLASSYQYGEIAKPKLGIKMELINGISIKGDYNLETETTGLGFSINLGLFEAGTTMNSNNDNTSGSYYFKTSQKLQRSISDYMMKFIPVYYDYNLSGKLTEVKPDGLKIGFMKINLGKFITLEDIKNTLSELEKNPYLKGIIIKNPKAKFGIADIEELKPFFDKFRKSGKKIIFYYDSISGPDYLLAASIADEIYLNPAGDLRLPQLGVKLPYLKELLDKLGINVQNLKSHKYKTAGNMFSETHMTDAEKETYKSLLGDISKQIKELITKNRDGKLKKAYDEILEAKPFYTAQEAYNLGLVDGLTYQSDLKNNLKKNGKKPLFVTQRKKRSRVDWADKSKSKVAIIYAVGSIHSGKNQYGKSIGSETLSQAIREARNDKSIKGIIIRVNSGGGSALASDIIAHEVELARKINKKPVVISMGRVAASGGYYISALANKIIAQPGTITGSIGVIGMIPEFSKLYKKVGVNWSDLKIDKYAGFPPTNRPMTDEEKKFMEDSIHKVYWDFVGVVAKGRNKTKEDVHKIAQGRVWSGITAYKFGLIDKLGGLEDAKSEIKNLAHIKNEIELVEFKGKCKNSFSTNGFGANVLLSLMPKEFKSTFKLLEKFKLYKNDSALYLTPIEVELKN